ncbi:Response regulator [Crenothrix polyspora]|uniref:Response regulator n=1 Tax=Crenothrix polyspora TaxID=360316 RepID=A0A1R4H185_9GAMM|nr:ANTAR domain-containing protein [Crenothrix polyspora]SJM89994.1 Response regulator [Crenothrix polyspora]
MNVLLIENNANSVLLEKALSNNSFDFLKIQSGSAFSTLTKECSPDVIIFNLDTPSEHLIADLYTLNQHNPLPVIMFASHCCNETINKVIKAEVSVLIIDGLTGVRINSIIQVAIAKFNQRQSLKDALEEARSQLEDRKQIDRAKAILIKTQNFTESVAYHTLRKLAMDRNITLGEMARNVIAMAELLK